MRKIYFVWKNVEYHINIDFNHVDYTELPSGEFLAFGGYRKSNLEPITYIPTCLILFDPQKVCESNLDQSIRFVTETSPHLPHMLENSHGFTEYKAVPVPYLDRYICPQCNEISQDLFTCVHCGSNVKHEVVLEWPGPSPITTVFGVHIVTQSACPNCYTQLSLEEQSSTCPNCNVKLQWHIAPSTPHMAY